MDKSLGLAVGALTGSVAAGFLTHPMDTIKTCMQGDVARVKYTSVLSTGKSLIAEYGVANGLFKGFFWRVSLISTTFFLVNTAKQALAPAMFPEKGPLAKAAK